MFGREGKYCLGPLMKVDPEAFFAGDRNNMITLIAQTELVGYRNIELMEGYLPPQTREKLEKAKAKA